ncbi:MAG: hypothetical protein GY742_00270 [Hyphomicrobiales bacterium]|nr:hypothetical protein [Hyphomicrobiales bacterium]
MATNASVVMADKNPDTMLENQDDFDQISAAQEFASPNQRGSSPNRPSPVRLAILGLIFALFVYSPQMREVVAGSLADAFLQVTVFVAATLALVFWIENKFSFSLGEVMRDNLRWQPAIASALGALPGCGGAIIVVTQFTKGYASFGAFIAVLVATMGDAAFLLIARDPVSFLIILSVSLVSGTITGMIVDKIHGADFLAVEISSEDTVSTWHRSGFSLANLKAAHLIWIAMVSVGLVIGIFLAFLIDVDEFLGPFATYSPSVWFGSAGAALSISLWAFSKRPINSIGADSSIGDPLTLRVIKDTNFVTGWVVVAFLLFDILVTFGGLEIAELFKGWIMFTPVVAILVGFIPGCGPQIVVASLYLAGAIPFSAQLANSIANDGDALFPALALAPRAAILATVYSAIPAVVIGYGWMFLIGG